MELLYAFLYLLALICFLVGTFGTWEKPKINLISLGLAFFVTPFLIQAFQVV